MSRIKWKKEVLDALIETRMHLTKYPYLHQVTPLPPNKISQLSKKYDVTNFDAKDICELWRIGLIRADYIEGDGRIEIPSITQAPDGENSIQRDRWVPVQLFGCLLRAITVPVHLSGCRWPSFRFNIQRLS